VISLVVLLQVVVWITPLEETQMAALRRRKKAGLARVPWLSDGATAAPFVWLAGAVSGLAWALVAQRLFQRPGAVIMDFPPAAWAVFAGVILGIGAIFHFTVETFGRRAAWVGALLLGLVPLFVSVVLVSTRVGAGHTAQYFVAASPLSAPWQPVHWMNQAARGTAAAFGPVWLFLGLHLALFAGLIVAWRRARVARAARA
jgi:hypothetical protein